MPLLRPKGELIVVILITTVVVAIYGNFFLDRTLESAVEQKMASILGTGVELDNFTFYFRGPAVSFERMRVIDPNNPWQNAIEIGPVGFFIEGFPLLRKSLIAQKISISEVHLGTERKSPGRIHWRSHKHSNWVDELEADLYKQISTPPVLDVLSREASTDTLFGFLSFESLAHLKTIRGGIDSTYDAWRRFLSEMEAEIGHLKGGTNSSLASSHSDDFKILEGELVTKSGEVRNNLARFADQAKTAQELLAEDLSALREDQTPLFEVTPEMVGKMVFGETTVRTVIQILRYVEIARRLIPGEGPILTNLKQENPPRFQGQDISFPLTHSIPRFSIREIIVKSPPNQKEFKDVRVRGEIEGLSSQPEKVDHLIRVELSAGNHNPRRIGILGNVDHTKEIPWEQFQLLGSGIKMLSLDLPKRPFLPENLTTERGKLSTGFEIRGRNINAHLSVTAVPPSFVFRDHSKGDTLVANTIRKIFESRERFQITIHLNSSSEELELRIASSVNHDLAEKFKRWIADYVHRDIERLYSRLEAAVMQKKEKTLNLIQNHQARVVSETAELQNRLR